MKKRVLSLLLVLGILLSCIPFTQFTASAEGGAENGWFRSQLTDGTALAFYEAMENMEAEGIFRTGTGAYDLTKHGYIPAETVAQYVDPVEGYGTDRLLRAYGAARDAYYMDHPGVFYVDFSNLTVSIVKSGDEHHVVLGAGRTADYYTYGFESEQDVEEALAAYDEGLRKAVAAADGKATDEEKILAVHNYITLNTSYRKEGKVKPENLGSIRTAYGALVNREGVCEAYTRAFKAAMDELGYPCVMVSGVYVRPDGAPEQHIWNYVQMEGETGTHWYMVDVTMDDPSRADSKETDGVEGFEGTEYFLVGRRTEQRNHIPNGVVSSANFEFYYPSLAPERYGTIDVSDENIPGLHVRYAKVPMEGIDAGGYSVDYNGKSAVAMREDGFYLLVRFFNEDTDMAEDGTEYTVVRDSGWVYVIPEMYPENPFFTDDGTENFLALPQTKYIQFAVTDVWTAQPLVDYLNAGVGTDEGTALLEEQYYKSDSAHLLAETAVYENPNGDYHGCPYVIPTDDYVNGRFYIDEGVQVMELTYDDILKPVNGDAPITLDFRCENISDEVQDYNSGKENSTLHSYEFINDYENQRTTVRFEFTPSKMWIDDSVLYVFTVGNAVGVSSNLPPMEFQFAATHRGASCCLWRSGIDLNVYGKPTLLDDAYSFDSNWVTEGGNLTDLAEYDSAALRDRMVLVVDDPTDREEHNMMEALSEKEDGREIMSQKSYNINLLVCNRKTLKTGKTIRLMLGFPEGYGPENEGVTFKAYHFTRDENDNVNGVEEIPCVITKYGLLVTCSAFSPFTVAAVEKDPDAPETKTFILSAEGEGSVTADGFADEATGTLVTLGEGQTAKITANAAEGCVISGITVGSQRIALEGERPASYTFEIDPETAADRAPLVKVTFSSAAALAAVEEEAGGVVEALVPPETPSDPLVNDSIPPEPEAPVTPVRPVPARASSEAPAESPAPSPETTTETAPEASPTVVPTAVPSAGGKADLDVAVMSCPDGYVLRVEAVSPEDAAVLTQKIGAGCDGVAFAEVSLVSKESGEADHDVRATVCIAYPEAAADPENYVYKLYHLTGGNVERVDAVVTAEGLLYTGTFSPFAIAYTRKASATPSPSPVPTLRPTETPVPVPKTGDTRDFTPLIVAMCAGGAGLAAVLVTIAVRRRRR